MRFILFFFSGPLLPDIFFRIFQISEKLYQDTSRGVLSQFVKFDRGENRRKDHFHLSGKKTGKSEKLNIAGKKTLETLDKMLSGINGPHTV